MLWVFEMPGEARFVREGDKMASVGGGGGVVVQVVGGGGPGVYPAGEYGGACGCGYWAFTGPG